MKKVLQPLIILVFLNCFCTSNIFSQDILQKRITLNANGLPVSDVLTLIEKRGEFFFSYNSNLIKPDSIVTIHVNNVTILKALETLFRNRFQYIPQDDHIIITSKPSRVKSEIKGRIVDKVTGEPVAYATVYEKRQLAATMTDEYGLFSLNLKSRGEKDSISVSRISYADTIVPLPMNTDELTIPITVIDKPLDSVIVNMMKRDWLVQKILSSKEIINSINLKNFISKQQFQISVLPGIGSHGKLSSQVVNKFSFNILGGYNGGVNGAEIGGLYNITNNNSRSFQVAGLFNFVGGYSEGVQIAGLFNKDSSVNGFQAAGLFNEQNHAKGFQVAGLLNKAYSMSGFQAGGLFNRVQYAKGVQIAGLFNKDSLMSGLQVAVVNINHKISGVQIGIVNISDSMQGIPIGLINLGKGIMNQLSLSFNEMGLGMISYKSGNPLLYNILAIGNSFNYNEKVFSLGYGLGIRMPLTNTLEANPELTSTYFYNGNWNKQNISARFQWNLQVRISKTLSVFAGPAVTLLYSRPGTIPDGYRNDLSNGMHNFSINHNVAGWLGWNAGVNFF